jgi:RimJ/RimL family protein N-acetyltransferase
MTPSDLDLLADIDGTIESTQYLHLHREGSELAIIWKLEERSLRSKLIEPNPLDDDQRFRARQITTGTDDGIALVAQHEGALAGALVAHPCPNSILRVVDLRIDYDFRRQGVGMGMLYQIIAHAKECGLRAVMAQSKTNNYPAARFLSHCGFELAGVDTHRHSNHDLVKEAVALRWYVALD